MRKVCREAFVRKEPCINGKRNLKITNYFSANGKCRPFRSTTNVFCESEKKRFCKCNVVDNLHYRTYDGQSIHFSGGCRYTLTRYNKRFDSCSFNIEIENEYRNGNKHLSHTKSVIIHMFGEKFELGKHRTLKVGNIQRSIPYEKGEDVRIFYSQNVVQFVAPKCSVHVAFDKWSNAFIEVSKKYFKKMNGICGDCNGIQDDLKTKSGKDVSKKKDKYSRIANSYRVTYPGKYCKSAEHISYKTFCRYSFTENLKARNLCSAILSRNNPFRKCGNQAHVDLKNFYEDCFIDMCANKNRRQDPKRVQCKTLKVLAEVCAESGIPGIKWRSHYKCSKKCGENEHFTHKASPCPRTCENHFFGTRRPCYDLPEREGCECNKGYIRDGALCVQPMHCSCINLCIDRKGSRMCWKWKARGDCEKFPEPMNIMCRKTCNFCQQRALSCENEISTKQCLLFRRQGLCFDEFYKSICGLTCNYDKCKCGDDHKIVEKCNANYIITTTHYSFARDFNGRCVKTVKQTYRPCCPNSWTNYGNCNLCTGKRNITMHSYDFVKMKCVLRSDTRYENCGKCLENVREKRDCINEKKLKTTVYFNKLIGCFQCVPDQIISTTEIKCKTTTVVKRIDKTTECTTIYKRTPLNCQCYTHITRRCCSIKCPRSKTIKYCENGIFIYRTLSYELKCNCIHHYSYRIEIPKCRPKRPIFGKCEKMKNKLFYCKAIETQHTANVNANCKCIRNTLKHERTCCCKEPHKYKKCNRNTGMLTTVYVSYQPVWRGKDLHCIKKSYETSVLINFLPYIIKRGICKSNHMRTIRIFRKFRDGCQIKTSFYKYEERCRCPKQIKTRKTCEFNRKIVKRFIKVLVNAQCVDKLMSKQEIPIVCPNDQINKTKCFHRRKTVTTISYYKHKCKCIKKIKRQIKTCTCRHRNISETTSKCDLNSCIQKHVIVFNNTNCEREQLVYNYACCCKPSIITTSHCSPITGQITTTTETFYVVQKKFRCNSKTVSSVKKLNCNHVKVIKQKCGQERNNYKKITTIRQILSKETCSCKTITTSIWKCCKLPKTIVRKSCKGNYFLFKVVKYKFDYKKINCISQTSHHIKRIPCPPIKVPFQTTYLPNCKYKQTRFYYEIQNCKCKLREHSEIYYYRCCQKKPQTVKCVQHNKLITTFTTFHLSSDRKKCIEYVRKATQNITCRKLKESRTKKISYCEIHIITDYYRVKNCKCEKYDTKVEKKRFCCMKPVISVSCLKNKIWRITTTKYTTKNFEICIKQTSFVDNVKRCPPPYSRFCPCIGNPNLRSIKRYFYVIVNCQCVYRKIIIPCPCHKIPNKIQIGYCTTRHTRTVKVFKSVNIRQGCKWKLLRSYEDVCECPKHSIVKTCLKHSIYRTTTVNYKLVTVSNQYPTHICVKSQIVTDQIIECNRNYIYYGRCINYRKSVTECVFRSKNCQCEMSCQIIRYRPCKCRKLNRCRITCMRNIKTVICYKYRPGPLRCMIYFRFHRPIFEKCPSKIDIQCKLSNHPINNCYYKSCQKSFYVYENCRCVKRTETTNTCSRCVKPRIERRCIHNRRIVKITNFIIRHNRCYRIIHKRVIILMCPRWKAIKTKKHGYIYYKIIYYKMKNCKCYGWICRGPNFKKKCPVSKLKRRCSRNNQLVYTHLVRQIYFTNRRLCPESGSPFRKPICRETRKIRIEPKKCPNSYERISCIVSRNIKKIEKHYYKVVNCRCVKAVNVVKTRPCKDCKKTITHESKCLSLNADRVGHVEVTTKYWKVTKENTCKPHVKKSKRICCIGKIRKISECVNGKKLFKTIIIEKATECKPKISIISESIPCYNNGKPNKWRTERIHYCRRPGEFTIKYLVRKKFNSKTCGCRSERKSVKIDICCRPCRSRTVCRHNNNYVTISYCQRPKKLYCENYKIKRSVQIRCPKPVTRVIGDCKGIVIRYRIFSYVTIQCKCVKVIKDYIKTKIRDVTKCINEMWKTTHIGYELYRHRCVPKQPQITFKPTTCSKFKTFIDRRIDHCDFYRSYFRKVVSNCRCVDRFVGKEILHYKCCQKPVEYETCLNHNTRVVYKTNFNLLNFKCYPVRRESRFTVDCSHFKLQERINTGRCTYKIQHYYVTIKNCKCYRVHKYTDLNLCYCCDHLRPYKEQKCDKERGRLINISYTYKLIGGKCHKIKSITYSPINCDGKICEPRYGKCIQNTQTIELYCLKRRGCQCVKQIIKRHNICCGPMKNSTWTEVGPCEKRRGYYQLVTTYALRLNSRTKQCTPVVIKQYYKVCCCRKSFVRKSCFKNIYIKTSKYSYSINFPKNSHDERIDESMKLISRCYKALNFTMDERETTPDGWCIRTSKIITPVNCKCLERIEETRFWCPCYKPVSVQIKKYCKNNNIIIETHYPKCRLNNIYWRIVKTITPISNCNKKQILYSRSFYYSWHKRSVEKKCCIKSKFERHLQWYVHDCVCRSREIEKRLICIESLKPRQKEQCLGSKIRVISYSYPIVNGICRKIVNKKLIHIPCPSQPKIHQSECTNNKYTITTTYYFYDNCRCRSRVEKRICDCQCNKDFKIIKCSRNYFLNEITTKYHRNDCRCFKTVNIKRIEPSCPRFIRKSIGKCKIHKNHSIYRRITNRYIKKDYRNCKCLVGNHHKKQVCDCKKQTKKKKLCINNKNFVIQIWGWKINERKNRCDKVLLKSDSKIISCPPTRISNVSNYNINKCKEITTTYKLQNCKCVENINSRSINCNCSRKPVLIQRGECQSNNIRIDVYSHKEPRGQHCFTVKENKYIICRCSNNTYSKLCVNDAFVTVINSYKLINNKCQESRIKTMENINCSTDIEKRESICHKYGYKTIEYYKLAVYNCKCMRTRIKLEYCSCKCPTNRIIQQCDESGKLLIDIQYNYQLVNCKCQLIKISNTKQIICPKNRKTVSKCDEKLYKHFVFKTTTIIEYNIHHCQCIETIKISKSLCKNNDFMIISIICNPEKKVEIREVLRVKFEDNKFVNTTTIEKIPITCSDNWFIARKSGCQFDGFYGTEILVYHRLVFNNCKCNLEIKNRRCDCLCKGPTESKKCEGNIIRKYHYKYELVNCKCERRIIKEESEKVYCQSKTLKTSPCYQKDNQCVKDVERQDSSLSNCQCTERRRMVQEICRSCCDGPPSTEKYCDEALNKFITKTRTCYVSTSGFIKNSLEIKEQDIPCKVGSNCVSVDGCNRKTSIETLKCTIKYLQNCMCLSKTEIRNNMCVCEPSKLEYGVCDKTLLTRPVYEIENRLVSLINGQKTCRKERKKIRDEICDCPKSNIIEKCINNRFIQKINKYTFNNKMKTCDSKISETDKTETCGPAFDKSTGTCDPKTNKRIIKIRTKQLINCKCITTEKIETELCRCEDRTETKCIDNRLLETTVIKYTMDNERKNCIPSINQSRKEIECSVLDVDPEKFYENNYEQCKKIVYEVKNCQCVQSTTPQKCACSLKCPVDKISTTCINGISRTSTTKSNLDYKYCKCITNITIDDKLIRCAETPKIEYATNKKEIENGIYDIVTSTSEQKVECECKKQSTISYKLISCSSNYNRINSSDSSYDFKCEIIKTNDTKCPSNSKMLLSNGRFNVTTYEIIDNKCVSQSSIVPCSECKTQYCVEDITSCISVTCSEDSEKALCPIKCEICEPCPSNARDCETNPFDKKEYRKIKN